jgi:hypothetical protein
VSTRIKVGGGALIVVSTIVAAIIAAGGSGLPPLGVPSCVSGAVNVTTAAAVQSNIEGGNDVCITADVGDVTLSSGSAYTSPEVEFLGTTGAGRIQTLFLDGVIGLNVRVRAEDVGMYDSEFITLEQSRLGGESRTSRVGFEAIDLRDTLNGCDDCVVRDNDIGWMVQDEDSGNSGFCIRAHGDNDRLQIVRNKIHDCIADAINGVRGDNVVIDRNEIGPVGDDPSCASGGVPGVAPEFCEHSDGIQLTGRDGAVSITNNWIHHEGFFTEPDGDLVPSAAASGTVYIHGSNDVEATPLLIENNLLEDSRGRFEVCNLGTGGRRNDHVTIRGNTVYNLAQAFGIDGSEWDCDTGTDNVIENNVFADNGGGFNDTGLARTLANNAIGALADFTFDGSRNCTSATCTTGTPKGYRKPSGVRW